MRHLTGGLESGRYWRVFRPQGGLIFGSGKMLRPAASKNQARGQNLTKKALVEFMRDGPKSVQQAGHWLIFAQEISVRDQHTLDEDVKMYFLNQIVAMDAFIAAFFVN